MSTRVATRRYTRTLTRIGRKSKDAQSVGLVVMYGVGYSTKKRALIGY
jgi:hypothetical protein